MARHSPDCRCVKHVGIVVKVTAKTVYANNQGQLNVDLREVLLNFE